MLNASLLRNAGRLGTRAAGLTRRVRHRFRRPFRHAATYASYFENAVGLEIGGPSAIFRDEKLIPLYRHVRRLDGVNFGTRTVWEGELRDGNTYTYLAEREPGVQFILEATDLSRIPSACYDVVLSSHTLEHTANPIKALHEWQRVLKPDGVLLLVLPHKERTFDHRRPTTELQHMIADYTNATGEDDLTHLEEILALHDLAKDPPAGDRESFRQRSLDNLSKRCLHHHVFDLRLAMQLVDYVGLQILRADTLLPFHIVILARKAQPPRNRHFLRAESEVLVQSCFASDRRVASEARRGRAAAGDDRVSV